MLFMSCVCYAFASVHFCHVVTCWEKAYLWLLFVMFKIVFLTFPCGIMGQVWYLIVSIPDIRRLSYFNCSYVMYLLFSLLWSFIKESKVIYSTKKVKEIVFEGL